MVHQAYQAWPSTNAGILPSKDTGATARLSCNSSSSKTDADPADGERAEASNAVSEASSEKLDVVEAQDPEEGAEEQDVLADAEDQEPTEGQQPPARSKFKIALIMLSLCICVLLAALDITIVTTALPTIAEHFQSAAGYTWIGSAYLIASSAATPIWGKISDIFGRKPMLLVANVIFFVGSTLAAAATSMNMLIAARAVQGIGGGGLICLVNIVISDLFAMRVRGAYFGIIGGVWALASSLGPVVGGLLTQKVSWRWAFYINLPLDGVAFFILVFVLDLHTPKTPLREGLKAVDWLGSLVMVGGSVMLLLGLEMGGISFPWKSATIICLLVFGVITLGLFLLVEHRFAPYPLMPLGIFSQRSNLATLGVCFFHSFVFISASYFLPLYFQAVLGATPILSGVYLLPTALSLSVFSGLTGVLIRKTGEYRMLIWTGLFLMTLGFGLFIDLDSHSSWAKIIIYQIIAGIGVGPNFQAPLIALQSLVPKRDIATATAAFGTIRNLGSAISVVVGSVIFQNQMASKQAFLRSELGPGIAAAFGGGSAGANFRIIQSLPPRERAIARDAFSSSLSTMWITYVAFSAVGMVSSWFITKNVLQKDHVETKTGIEEERKKRTEREAERGERKRRKKAAANGGDVEKGGIAAPNPSGVTSGSESTPEPKTEMVT